MLKFIHTADLHIDSYPAVYKADKRRQKIFSESTKKSFEKIVDLAIENSADFITIGGDLFDAPTPSINGRLFLRKQFLKLKEKNIKIYISAGNHDTASNDFFKDAESIGNVYLFDSKEVSVYHIDGYDIKLDLYGISFKKQHTEKDLSQLIIKKAQNSSVNTLKIALLHCSMGKLSNKDNFYAPCTLNNLISSNIDIWLLGHIHKKQILNRQPLVIYPGNIQGRDINEDGEKGAYLISIDKNSGINYEFLPTAGIIFKKMDLEYNPDKTFTAWIYDEIDKLSQKYSDKQYIFRISLNGYLSKAQMDQVNINDLRDDLNENAADNILIEKIEDNLNTEIPNDEAILKEQSTRSIFLEEYNKISKNTNTIDSEHLCKQHIDVELLKDKRTIKNIINDLEYDSEIFKRAKALALRHLTQAENDL